MQKFTLFGILAGLLALYLLIACIPEPMETSQTQTPTYKGTLRPYPSGTATETPLPTGYNSPTPSPTITPTPTPVYYEVQLGDDMYSIAWRYNLSPAEVMTANPTINPRAMSVGMQVLIPITPTIEPTPGDTQEVTPTPTETGTEIVQPDCYPDALGGLWCFVLVENEEETSVENLSAVVTLEDGDEARQEVAIMPLNLLPPGQSLPLIAYFEPPVSDNYEVSAEIDFFLPVMPDDDRYIEVEIVRQDIEYSEDRKTARVTGYLRLSDGQTDAEYLWINATAFDADGKVVAVRRWDVNETLPAGEESFYDLTLYSMGGEIDRVDMMVEAHRLIVATPSE
jgi:LysM repeat protein